MTYILSLFRNYLIILGYDTLFNTTVYCFDMKQPGNGATTYPAIEKFSFFNNPQDGSYSIRISNTPYDLIMNVNSILPSCGMFGSVPNGGLSTDLATFITTMGLNPSKFNVTAIAAITGTAVTSPNTATVSLAGGNVTFACGTAGGTWTSDLNISVGTIVAGTGVFTPSGLGTTLIMYWKQNNLNYMFVTVTP